MSLRTSRRESLLSSDFAGERIGAGRRAIPRVALGLGLAALSAVLFTLAFPPYALWPLVFVGLVPMVVAQHRVLPRQLSGLAVGVGVGGFFWGYFSGTFAGSAWYMRWLPLFIGGVAALVGGRDRAFHQRTGYRWFVLHGATLWVGIEMVRGSIPVVGTWGFAAYALYEQPWLIQPVSLFGVYGLSLLVLLVNYLHDTQHIRVAGIQPGFRIRSQEGLQRLYDLTRQAADQGAELIVWHEGALPFDPRVEHTEELRALAAETRAHIVIGYAVRMEQGLRNEVTVLTPEGRFLGVYGKDHPVAFAGETSLTRGTYPVYETPLGRLGTIICYDMDFTDTARKVARGGAQLIAVPSFDWPAVATKHYSHVVFRAVENRVAMVKADVAFDSAIIAPDGRILARAVTPYGGAATLVADVPLGTADAPAIRLGDGVGWLAVAATIGFPALDLKTRNQRNSASSVSL